MGWGHGDDGYDHNYSEHDGYDHIPTWHMGEFTVYGGEDDWWEEYQQELMDDAYADFSGDGGFGGDSGGWSNEAIVYGEIASGDDFHPHHSPAVGSVEYHGQNQYGSYYGTFIADEFNVTPENIKGRISDLSIWLNFYNHYYSSNYDFGALKTEIENLVKLNNTWDDHNIETSQDLEETKDIFFLPDFKVHAYKYEDDVLKLDQSVVDQAFDGWANDHGLNKSQFSEAAEGETYSVSDEKLNSLTAGMSSSFMSVGEIKSLSSSVFNALKDFGSVNDLKLLAWDEERKANWKWNPSTNRYEAENWLIGSSDVKLGTRGTIFKLPVTGSIYWDEDSQSAKVIDTSIVYPKDVNNSDNYSDYKDYLDAVSAIEEASNTVTVSRSQVALAENGEEGAEEDLDASIQAELANFDLSEPTEEEKIELQKLNLELEVPDLAGNLDIRFVVPEDGQSGQEGQEGQGGQVDFPDDYEESIENFVDSKNEHDSEMWQQEYEMSEEEREKLVDEVTTLGEDLDSTTQELTQKTDEVNELLGQQEADQGKINELTAKVDSLEVQLKNAEDAEQIAIQNGNNKLAEEVARHRETIEKAAADAKQAKTKYENSLQQKDDAAEAQRKQLQTKIDEAVKSGQDAVKAAEDAAKTNLENQKSEYEQKLTDAATAAQTAQQIAVEDAIKVERAQAVADAAIAEGKAETEIAAKQKEVDDAKNELIKSQADLSVARTNYQTAENNYNAQLKINQNLNDTLTGEKKLRTAAESEAKRLGNELIAKQALLDIATATNTALSQSLSAAQKATQDAIAAGDQAAIEAANDKEKALKELSDQSEKDIEAKQSEINNLNATLKDYKDEAAVDLKSINDLTSERDSLVTEKNNLQTKLDEANQATQDAIAAGDEQATAISEAAAEQLKLKVAEKDGELQSKQAELNSANARASSLQTEVDSLKGQKTTLEDEKKALKDQLSVAEQATRDAEAKGQADVVEAQRLAAENLANQIKAKDDEIGSIQEKLDNSVIEEARLTGVVDDLKAQNTNLSNTIRDRDNSIKLLESDKLSLQSQLALANAATEEAEAKGQADVAEAERLAAQELKNKIAQKDKEIKVEQDKLTAEKEKLRKANVEISRLTGVETGLRQDIIDIRSELDSEKDKLSSMTGERDDLATKLSEEENKLSSMTSERDSLQSQLDQARIDITTAVNEGNTKLQQEQEKAAKELEDAIAEKDNEIDGLNTTIDQKNARIGQLNDEMINKNSTIKSLNNQLTEADTEISGLEGEVERLTQKNIDDLAAQATKFANDLDNALDSQKTTLDDQKAEELSAQADQFAKDLKTALEEKGTTLSAEHEKNLQDQANKLNKAKQDALDAQGTELEAEKNAALQQQAQNLADAQRKALEDQSEVLGQEKTNALAAQKTQLESEFSTKLSSELAAQLQQLQQAKQDALNALGTELEAEKNAALVEQAKNLADAQKKALEDQRGNLEQEKADALAAQANQFSQDLQNALSNQATSLRTDFDIEKAKALQEQSTKFQEDLTNALSEQGVSLRGDFDVEKANALSAQATQFEQNLANALAEQGATLSSEKQNALNAQRIELENAAQAALDAQGTELEADKQKALSEQATRLADAQKKALEDQAGVLNQQKLNALSAQKIQLEGEAAADKANALANAATQYDKALEDALAAQGTELEQEKLDALALQAQQLATAQQNALDEQKGILDQEKLDALTEQKNTYENIINGLSGELDDARGTIGQRDTEIIGLKSQISQNQNKIDGLKTDIATLEGNLGDEQKKLNDMTGERDQLQSDLESSQNNLNSAIAERDNFQAELTQAEKDIEDAIAEGKTDVADAKREAAKELDRQIGLKDDEIKQLENDISSKDTKISEFESSIESQGTQISNLQSDLGNKQEKIDDFTVKLDAANKRIGELEIDAESKDTKITNLEGQISENQTTIDGLENDVTSLENQLNAAQKATQDAIASGDQALIDQAQNAEDTLNAAITEKNNQLDVFTKRNAELINERDEALRLAEGASLGLPSFAEDIYDEGINDRIFGDMFTSAFATELPELDAPTIDIHYADLDAAEQAHEDFLNDSRFEYNSWKFGQAQNQLAEFADSKPDKFAEMGQKINDLLMVGDMDPMTKAEQYLDIVANNLVFGAGMSPMQALGMGINTIEGTLGVNLTDIPSLGRLSSNILEKFGSVVPDEIKNLFDRLTPDSVKNNFNATTGYLNQNFNFWDNLLADSSYSSQIRAGLPPSIQAVEEYQEKMWNALMVDPATGQPAFAYSDLKEEDKLSWAQQGLDFLNNLGGTTKTIVVDGQEFEVPKNLEGESWLGKFAAPIAGGIDLLGEGISKTTGFLEDLAFQQKKLTGGFVPNMAANALLGAATGVPLPWNNVLSFLLAPFAPQGSGSI
jgi:chromosome segregation ATPase